LMAVLAVSLPIILVMSFIFLLTQFFIAFDFFKMGKRRAECDR
jgi:hypothetical protein